MVAAEWAAVTHGDTTIERWQNEIRYLRYFLMGWAKNTGKYKKEKDQLLFIVNDLDIKAESLTLSSSEQGTLRDASEHVSTLRHDEETKWA
jgi:hypothetical protein